MSYKKYIGIIICAIVCISALGAFRNEEKSHTITTNAGTFSNQKIEWGIKRNDNHEQPDLGSKNKKIIDENKGIAMGNKESKKVYLTFDEGYEAGYTEKILEVLKKNNVKATFFITAHYVNTSTDLVQKMIDEGHIIGNHFPNSSMYLKINES